MKNESTANNPRPIGPADSDAFRVDVRKGQWRCVFYFLVIYVALVCGCLSAAQSADLAALRSSIIALLFLPFIYLYSVPFEVSTKEHFPDPVIGIKNFFTGPYAMLGRWAVFLTVPFGIGLGLSLYTGLLPVQAYPICFFGSYAACQMLYAGRYRLLQVQRYGEDKVPGVWSSPFFCIPPVCLILLTAIPMIPSLFYENLSMLEATVVALLLTLLSAALIPLGDYIAKKNRSWLESPKFREPLVLISTLFLPFFLGRTSAILASEEHVTLARIFILRPRNLSILVTIFAVGWVFELLRYLADYPAFASRLELSRDEIPRRFQNSVTNYFYIFVCVICSIPFVLLIIGEATLWYAILVAIFVCILMIIVAGHLRPYDKMCFVDPSRKEAPWVHPLVKIKVVGYLIFLSFSICTYARWLDTPLGFSIQGPTLMALCAIPFTLLTGLVNMRITQYSDNSSLFRWPLLFAPLLPLAIVLLCLLVVVLSYGVDSSRISAGATVSHLLSILRDADFAQGAAGLSWIYLFVGISVTISIGCVRRAFEPPGEQLRAELFSKLRADLFSKLPCRDILSAAEKNEQDDRTTTNGVPDLNN